jgi:hypothetical protein
VLTCVNVEGGFATTAYIAAVNEIQAIERDAKILRAGGDQNGAAAMEADAKERADDLSPNVPRFLVAGVFRWIVWIMVLAAVLLTLL